MTENIKEKLREISEKVNQKEKVEVQKSNTVEGRITSLPIIDNNKRQMLKEIQSKFDDIYIVSKMLDADPKSLNIFRNMQPYLEVAKALDTTWGADWLPTQLSEDLVEAVQYELKVASLHKVIKMPTPTFEIPGLKGGIHLAHKKVENDTPVTFDLSGYSYKVTLSAKTVASYIELSYELVEDAVVAMLPIVKDLITKSIATSMELAVLDGDTSTTHMDADVTVATDPRKLWKGYRRYALDNSLTVNAGGTFSIDVLKAMMQMLGPFLGQKDDLVLIVSPSTYVKMLGWEELLTVDKYGPNATLLKGEVARIFDIPVIMSGYIREDLNADGVYGGTDGAKTVAFLVYKSGFVFGERGGITLETDKDIKSQKHVLVASRRLDFAPLYANGEPIVVMAYNINV